MSTRRAMTIRARRGVTGALVAFGIALTVPAAAIGSEAFEAQRSPTPARKWKAQIEEIHVQRAPDGNVFSGIVPCTKVLRSIWDAAQGGQAYSLKFNLKYTSGDKVATKTVQVPLASMKISRHHQSTADYVVVGTVVDVADKPVDASSKITGSVHVNHSGAR